MYLSTPYINNKCFINNVIGELNEMIAKYKLIKNNTYIDIGRFFKNKPYYSKFKMHLKI